MKCKICSNEVGSFKDNELKKIFYYCQNCESIFLDSSFYVDNIDEKKQYDHHNNSLENKGYIKMFENFLDYFWSGSKNVLDFGSGPTPVLATLMKKRTLHVDHFDKFYQIKKVYKNKRYDLITSTEVFEHLKNPKEILTLLKNHLAPNGTIAIMTLFHTNNQDDFLKWWYRRDPTHIVFFTPKTFEVLAKKCGLTVLKHDNKRVVILRSVSTLS